MEKITAIYTSDQQRHRSHDIQLRTRADNPYIIKPGLQNHGYMIRSEYKFRKGNRVMANRNSIRQRRIRKLDKVQRRKLRFYGISRQYWITIQEADARKGYTNEQFR